MTGGAKDDAARPAAGRTGVADAYKRDFWIRENRKHATAHYRLRRTARLVNRVAGGAERDLLDVGCGPATLSRLLPDTIHYYGIDIALQHRAPNLLEADILEGPIAFGDRRFDIVVAQGLFEYVGDLQDEKLADVARLLTPTGTFVVTYTNFSHRDARGFEAFSNVRPLDDFRHSLRRWFVVTRSYPTSYNWHGGQPRRRLVTVPNDLVSVDLPFVGRHLAVEYFFVCSPRGHD